MTTHALRGGGRAGGWLLVLLAAGAVSARAADAVPPGDWPAYNRTLAGDRYSPLRRIDRSNVGGLRLRCSYELPEVASFQSGPLAIAGALYFTTDTGSYAIDAATCRVRWIHRRPNAVESTLQVNRGFAYLNGTLYRGTADGYVIALSAADGHQLWAHHLDVAAPGVSVPMAPIAYDGRIYVGNAGGDNVGVTGHVYALDARDGHVVWRFDSVPATVRHTWTNPKLPITGGAFWTSFTLDPVNDVLYVPAGNPAPDFNTIERTGDDLYTDSVIALDATSGRMLGYHQISNHDFHDWDVDSAPTLVTTRQGRELIASANKDGLLSILDRSGVRRAARTRGADAGPPIIPLLSQTPTTTRSNTQVPLSADHPVHFCPGFNGGTEWNGAAYSPSTDSIFVAAVDRCANVQLQRPLRIPAAGQLWFAATGSPQQMLDPIAQASGWLTAYDAENGRVRWKFHAPHPMVAAVTPTAGDVVFGADLAGILYALDQRSGQVLWRVDTGQSTGGGIVTYEAGGRQLVAFATGMNSPVWPGGARHSRILVYGLP